MRCTKGCAALLSMRDTNSPAVAMIECREEEERKSAEEK
jgi:hypothetical protein